MKNTKKTAWYESEDGTEFETSFLNAFIEKHIPYQYSLDRMEEEKIAKKVGHVITMRQAKELKEKYNIDLLVSHIYGCPIMEVNFLGKKYKCLYCSSRLPGTVILSKI